MKMLDFICILWYDKNEVFLKIRKCFEVKNHESFDEHHVCFEYRGAVIF